MRSGLKVCVLTLAGITVLGGTFSTVAEASIVRFEGTFGLFNESAPGGDYSDICPVDSACAAAFEESTGITITHSGSRWNDVRGDFRFNYDTVTSAIHGGLLTLSSFDNSDKANFAVGVGQGPVGGHAFFCFGGGIGLYLSSPEISGEVTYCDRATIDPFDTSDLNDVISSPPNSFRGTLLISKMGGPGWNLWVNGGALNQIAPVPEPATLALVGAALLGVAAARRRKLTLPIG